MIKIIYPIDKSDLLIHFLALAVVFVRYIPRIGQNSLPMFCLVVFLSFAATDMARCLL